MTPFVIHTDHVLHGFCHKIVEYFYNLKILVTRMLFEIKFHIAGAFLSSLNVPGTRMHNSQCVFPRHRHYIISSRRSRLSVINSNWLPWL